MTKENTFVSEILEWHKSQKVIFPWRQTKDPYKILVSELLLRKTTRKQVSMLYNQFFSTYQTVEALSKADIRSIEAMIRPLGMEHIRAAALKQIAEAILHVYGGNIPSQREELLSLPHIGPYIANAVLCFAFGEDAPLLDTNIVRVTSRIFSFKSKKKRAREDPAMWKAVEKMIPKGRARDFNLAMLDFADSMCTPKNPKCTVCPMRTFCDYERTYIEQMQKDKRN